MRRGGDGVERGARVVGGDDLGADTAGEPVDGREPREIQRPVVHDAHGARGRQAGTAIGPDADGVVGDVDIAARQAVGGGDEADLGRGVDHAGARGQHDLPDPHGEIEYFGDPRVIGQIDRLQWRRSRHDGVGHGLPVRDQQADGLGNPRHPQRSTRP